MDLAFLIAYIALIVVAYLGAQSTAWLVITIAGSAGAVGALISFAIDRGHAFVRLELQWLLLLVLALVAVIAWVRPFGLGPDPRLRDSRDLGVARQALAVWLPVALLLAFIFIVTVWWTEEPAFLRPVSFLIGHGVAEDNAKWLDFTSQWAAGTPIMQAVPMGGPLQLLLTFVGTVMAVVSGVMLGGFNEVAVAANAVVYGEFFLIAIVPLALAPLVETRIRGSRIPAPLLWTGMLVLSTMALAVTKYGHLTFQFTLLVAGLWVATFLSAVQVPRARLVTSLAAAASMTVWLPLNVVAIVVCIGWGITLLTRGLRFGWRRFDVVGFVLLLIVTLGVFEPVVSSISYLLFHSDSTATGALGGVGRGVGALVGPSLEAGVGVRAGLAESALFAATGGTDATGPILAVMAVAAVFVASLVLSPVAGPLRSSLFRRFLPLAILTFFAVSIYVLDAWATGAAPHYGSMKFTLLVATLALACCVPVALMLIDVPAGMRMTTSRWIAIGGVFLLLILDSVLPRSIALLRPEQWSPPIPFNNTSGSYWWPADVNGKAVQPIAKNPIACLYLPKGATAPTAIVPSGLSDPQRVYACTRQLAGLAGLDTPAQPIVDWLRREWFTNTPAWSPVYDSLAALPDTVLDRPVILLDDGSNIIGLESLRSLLARYPKNSGQ